MGRWRCSFCAVVLLAALAAGCGHPIDPSVVDPFCDLRQKLGQTVCVDWQGVPLETAARELGEQCGITIRLDRDRLAEDAVSPSQPVSLQVHDVRARSVLRLLLDDVGAGYLRENGELTITSRDAADTQLEERLYATADVTRDAQFGEEQLAEVIQEIVKSDSWEEAGGPGTIDVRPGALLIKQTWRWHEEIDDLLAELRWQAGSSRHTPCAVPNGHCDRHSSPATTAIYQVLDTRVTVDINTPGPTVLRELAAQHKINLVVQWSKLYESAEFFESRVRQPDTRPMVLTDVTWGVALDLLLEPHGLDWTVRDDVLLVTSRDEADTSLAVRTYRVPPEIKTSPSWWGMQGGLYHHGIFTPPSPYLTNKLGEFADDLRNLIRPDSWQDAGGPGNVRAVPSCLVVSQTQRVHHELARYLGELRRARDPRVIDYDERATSPQAARLWQLLQQPVTMNFGQRQVSLRQALEDLRQRYGLANIVIDAKRVVEEAQVDPDKDSLDLDLTSKDVLLEAVLDLLLDSRGLGWFVHDNVVIVTSRDRAVTTIVNRAYRCPALARRNDADTILEAVNNTVQPNSWQESGGPGVDECLFSDVLSVSQTCRIHRQVRRFLEAWEASLDGGADAPPQFAMSPSEQRLREAMEQRVTYSCQDRELTSAVGEVSQQVGVRNIHWDWPGIENETPNELLPYLREQKVHGIFKVLDEPAGDVLTRLLGPRKLVWTIKDDVLCITSDLPEPHLIAGFYRLPEDVAQDDDGWADLITDHLRPDSWRDAGGPGGIEFTLDNLCVVSHSWSMHRQLQLFLRQLRTSVGRGRGADGALGQAGPNAQPLLVVSPAERALLKALDKPVTFSAKDRPLPEVLAALARLGGVKLAFDPPKLDASTVPDLEQYRVSLDVRDEPLSEVLTRLVEAHCRWWVPQQDEILVTRDDPGRAITGIYRVPQSAMDLFEATALLTERAVALLQATEADPAPAETPAATSPDPFQPPAQRYGEWIPWTVEDDLHEMLVELLAPEKSWVDSGGLGRLTVVPLKRRQGVILVLTHTAATHGRAKRLLEGCEKTPAWFDELLKLLKPDAQDRQPPMPRKRRVWAFPSCGVVG